MATVVVVVVAWGWLGWLGWFGWRGWVLGMAPEAAVGWGGGGAVDEVEGVG